MRFFGSFPASGPDSWDRRLPRRQERHRGRHAYDAGSSISYCVFIDPELGRVGLSEREARAAGVRYRLATNQALLRLDPMAPTLAFLLADAIWGGASH